MTFIYTICKNKKEAKKLGEKIIRARLAACANVWPIESVYFWGDKLRKDKEVALLLKTTKSKAAAAKKFIEKSHSYTVPFVGIIDLKNANQKYKNWALGVMKKKIT